MIQIKSLLVMMLFGALMAAGVMTAEHAYADPALTPAEYADAVRYEGYYCAMMDAQPNVRGIRAAGYSIMGDGFNMHEAADILAYVVTVYCPRHLQTIDDVAHGYVHGTV